MSVVLKETGFIITLVTENSWGEWLKQYFALVLKINLHYQLNYYEKAYNLITWIVSSYSPHNFLLLIKKITK